MTPLKRRIIDLITATGPMTVQDYMATCLFDPQDGYYTTRDPFGRTGDFTTAPEISQMFGELVAVWLIAAWRALGAPRDAAVVEIGPGRGTLMRDMVRTITRLEADLAASARFHLIEASPRLKDVQTTLLGGLSGTFEWHADVDTVPRQPLFLVANELFDAIPVRQYVKLATGWRERCIDVNAEELRFVAGAGSLDLSLLPPGARDAPDGTVAEIAPARSALMHKIAERIATAGGAGLFVDYGHLVRGVGDTLQAVRRHVFDDPLAHPGEADLTTHVDFAVLADIARARGLAAHLTTQGAFLLGTGLLERAGRLGADTGAAERDAISAAVERLAGPDAMGELFKVMAVLPKDAVVPPFGPAG